MSKNCMKCQVFWFKESLCNDEVCSNYYAKGNEDDFIKMIGRPKGKWIPVTNGRGGHECSVCHGYAPSYQNSDEFMSDFCPYCGAEMNKGETHD